MTLNSEKAALRKYLLEKRDATSFDLIEIHSKKIFSKITKTKIISDAKKIGCYASIGSEVQTEKLINYLIEHGKTVSLPKVTHDEMTFRIVENFSKLEKGEFDIPEPKDNAPIQDEHDVIIVPCVGLDPQGNRIGYGFGFYDKFLEGNDSIKIAIAFSKQIVKNIPVSSNDVKMDWIITEKDVIKTS